MPRLVCTMTDSLAAGFVRGQAAYLRERGFDVTVVTAPGPGLDALAASDHVRTIGLPMHREIAPWHDAVSLVRMVRLLRRLRPDIVNAGTAKAALLGMIAAWWVGVPVRIYTVHGLRMETTRGLKRRLLSTTERITAACAQRLICVSESMRRVYVSLFPSAAGKARVLASGSCNGIDPGRFRPSPELNERADKLRRELGIPTGVPVIGFVGRLVRDKGVAELVAAFDIVLESFPDARLLLLGDFEGGDPLPAACVQRLRQDPRIILPGFIHDTPPYYALMTVLAFPSLREGFGVTVIEAAAAELPVAGFASTGVVNAAQDGVTATLVSLGDADALAAAIVRYLSDPELARAHGCAGRARVEREFRHEVVWAAIEREYRELLAGAGQAAATSADAPREGTEAPWDYAALSRWTVRLGMHPSGSPITADEHGAAQHQPASGGGKVALGVKRMMDVVVAATALILAAVPMLAIAAAIRVVMGSPVLFRQIRPGRQERCFTLYKFRTMTDERGPDGVLLPYRQRITRLGRLLRRTSLDELPQLFNILYGDMSLVGPRPLLERYLSWYSPRERLRFDVRPGITGLAQSSGRNRLSWDDRLELDAVYVEQWSLWLDFRILGNTVLQVLRAEGVESDPSVVKYDLDEERRRAAAQS